MLANLPAKRATRKIISLKDGFPRSRKPQVVQKTNVTRKNKIKCGKIICHSKKVANNVNSSNKLISVQEKCKSSNKNSSRHVLTRRKSLRCISKVLSSRILDTDTTLVVKRKLKSAINRNSSKNATKSKQEPNETLKAEKSDKKSSKPQKIETSEADRPTKLNPATVNISEKQTKLPDRTLKVVRKSENVRNKYSKKKISSSNIKSFFPVIKTRSVQKKIVETCKSVSVKTKQKCKSNGKTKLKLNNSQIKDTTSADTDHVIKKSKLDVGNFLRSLSIRKLKAASNHKLPKNTTPAVQQTKKPITKQKFYMNLNTRKQSNRQTVAQTDGASPSMSPRKTRKRVQKSFFRKETVSLVELSNAQEFDAMPLLEKIPDTPEKCDLGIDLPVLTPAIPEIENFAEKTSLDHMTESDDRNCDPIENKEVDIVNREAVDMELEQYNVNDLALETKRNSEELNKSCIVGNNNTNGANTVFVKEVNTIGPQSATHKTSKKSKKLVKGLDDCIAMLRNKLQQKHVDSDDLTVNVNKDNDISTSSSEVLLNHMKESNATETICLETDVSNKTLDNASGISTEKFNINKQMEETFVHIQENSDCKKECSFETILTSNQLEGLEKCIPLLTNNASTKEIKGELDHLIDFLVAELKKEEISNQKLLTASCNELQSTEHFKESSNSKDDSLDTTLTNSEINSLNNILSVSNPAPRDFEEPTCMTVTDLSIPENTSNKVNDNIENNVLISADNKKVYGKRKLKKNSFSSKKKKTRQRLLKQNDQTSDTDFSLHIDGINKEADCTVTSDTSKENYSEGKEISKEESVCSESGVNIVENSSVPCSNNNNSLQASDSEDELPLVVFAKTVAKVAEVPNNQNNEHQVAEVAVDEKPEKGETKIEQSNAPPTKKTTSGKKKSAKRNKSKNKCKSLNNSQIDKQKSDLGEVNTNDLLFTAESETVSQQYQDTNQESNSQDEKQIDVVHDSSTLCPERSSSSSKENTSENQDLQTNSESINSKVHTKENSNSYKQDNGLDMWNAESSEWIFSSSSQADSNNAHVDPESNLDTSKSESEPKVKPKRLSKHAKKKNNTVENSGNKDFHCTICNKSFVRNEYLLKHMKTLTHIAKLSEIEAQQATESDIKSSCNETESDINICNILQDSNRYMENKLSPSLLSSTFSLNTTNSNTLKLADIINDVLNKPVDENCTKHNTFSNILQSTENVVDSKIRRCKSLGERKSFESDNFKPSYSTIDNNMFAKAPECADSILEKQISLLENIIVNNTGLNYVDDISLCSNQSLEECTSNQNSASNLSSLKNSNCVDENDTQKSSQVDFNELNSSLKSVQYEEISEDSSNFINQFEDQKSRKALNRDEELFLECCSLLKSGSEISTCSKKSNMTGQAFEKVQLQPHFNSSTNFMSDTSRLPTPLGDSFGDDPCSSTTLPFNWGSDSASQNSNSRTKLGNECSNSESILKDTEFPENDQGKRFINKKLLYLISNLNFQQAAKVFFT